MQSVAQVLETKAEISATQSNLMIVLLFLSLIFLLTPYVIFLIRKIVAKWKKRPTQDIHVGGTLVVSCSLLAAIWCLRFSVGYFVTLTDTEVPLEWWEEFFNSFAHALQTFSMDEDYTAYILNGKAMLKTILGVDTCCANLYGFYASLLNLAAPIAGGAIILDILASSFPKVRLQLSFWAFWREKYFFSELNSCSLELARDIRKTHRSFWRKPVIIFTDTYLDDEVEHSAELILEAKRLGALCIRDDLAHVPKNRCGKRTFFLIDESTVGNLETLTNLANDSNYIYMKKAEIFLFTTDDSYIRLEQCVRNQLVSERGFTEDDLPVFVPVQSYRNLVSNMLVEMPLYEPLIGKERNADGTVDLNVTILGAGGIGTEMFLSTYWLGQLRNCNLTITVLSNETEEAFWSKIDYVNPEIWHTTREGDPILRINKRGDMAEPYCRVNYVQCDAKSSKFVHCLAEPSCGADVSNSDYILVALGSDDTNISVANTVRKFLGQRYVEGKRSNCAVITYVVYNSELAETLNQETFFGYSPFHREVYMRAVGSSSEVYSVRNVYMTEHLQGAANANASYDMIQNRQRRAEAHRKRMKDDYKFWASMARSMHVKYKVFSMDLLQASVFGYVNAALENQRKAIAEGDTSPEAVIRAACLEYQEAVDMAYETYMDIADYNIEFDSEADAQAHLQLLHEMAWLEHRRWNAFTRVKGFRCPESYRTYAVPGVGGSYKQMDLRLHPCLVECDKRGIRAVMEPTGRVDEATVLERKDDVLIRFADADDLDDLDILTRDLYHMGCNGYDLKVYDYPNADVKH